MNWKVFLLSIFWWKATILPEMRNGGCHGGWKVCDNVHTGVLATECWRVQGMSE